MPRRDRLARWADVLSAHGGSLEALQRIEYLRPAERRAYRAENTPLTVAFRDPVLRDEGLKGDTLGDVMDFFQLSEGDAHTLFCDCHHEGSMTGSGLSARLRSYIRRHETPRTDFWRSAASLLFGRERNPAV